MEAVALAQAAQERLAAAGDAQDAAAMQAYMKTDMPFHGVRKPARVVVLRELAAAHPVADADDYVAGVLALWAEPHREAKYLAIAWARRWRAFVVAEHLWLYERLVVEGAWWDLVDEVASHLVGQVLLGERAAVTPMVRGWIDHDDLWLRRTAIICQLRHREATDEALLFDACLARAHERAFFVRKAIGWALRQHARTAPGTVSAFLLAHREAWSGLTWREATKHLDLQR